VPAGATGQLGAVLIQQALIQAHPGASKEANLRALQQQAVQQECRDDRACKQTFKENQEAA